MLRRLMMVFGATAMVAGIAAPAWATVPEPALTIAADGSAKAFAIRPGYDEGGANPLNFYIGYSEANVSTPSPQADGEAAWYNLNIVETAAFGTSDQCTPERNAAATAAGVK